MRKCITNPHGLTVPSQPPDDGTQDVVTCPDCGADMPNEGNIRCETCETELGQHD